MQAKGQRRISVKKILCSSVSLLLFYGSRGTGDESELFNREFSVSKRTQNHQKLLKTTQKMQKSIKKMRFLPHVFPALPLFFYVSTISRIGLPPPKKPTFPPKHPKKFPQNSEFLNFRFLVLPHDIGKALLRL